jgi:hypothetical protein
MRSLRLSPELDEKLQRAAAINGESVSEFIRRAAPERAEETLAMRPANASRTLPVSSAERAGELGTPEMRSQAPRPKAALESDAHRL